MLEQWREFVEIAKSIIFYDLEEKLLWRYKSNGVYSSYIFVL
jgi:hypothetical protein